MAITTVSPLERFRRELGVSRDTLARRTLSLTLSTIANVEKGRTRPTFASAQQILKAINELRAESGLPTVTMSDLELTVY